ncbi:hypothetical protein SD72_06690 [Leucobacter komagatae]|uniref:Uncharacterized protein n=2 Tax=Leucobacter komagatae TaxID=55969 RepID=A0A0D0HZ57_9MICO|nr:hypothetical protein SD72_06690 [Leucobacter komagatae]
MVLTDRDFGRAYITDGWATQFLTRLFARYTVVLIGYSAEDTIIQYLNRALPNNGERFAFTRSAEDYELWNRLGITPIPFPSPDENPFGALESFIGRWGNRLTASASQRFDEITEFVARGPEAAEQDALETSWTLNDPELARYFRSKACSSNWLKTLDKLQILDQLFDPEGERDAGLHDWSEWACASIDDDDGAALLAVLALHQGKLHQHLWFQIWHKVLSDFNGSLHHRQLIFVLAVSQQPQESDRLSMLLPRVVDTDPEVAELLLHHMLTPQLRFKVRSGWAFRDDSLETRLRLWWRTSSIRDAWPKLMPRLSNRTHMLSVVLDLIRTVERTDAFFTGSGPENAISVRRSQVEYAERYARDDPYILVVDIARDLLRESVRDHGVSDATRYLDDRSEMIRRLALDALAEARSTDADALIKILIQQALPFEYRSRPEVFRLMAAIYKNSATTMRQTFLDYIQNVTHSESEIEVNDYDRYNIFVWLTDTVAADDPVHALRHELERKHGYTPDEYPNLTSVVQVSSRSDPPREVEGRFRSFLAVDVVRRLLDDRTLQDEHSSGPTLRELHDYLEQNSSAHFSLLDEMAMQGAWNASAWKIVLQHLVQRSSWTASDVLQRLHLNAENRSEIAARLGFSVAYPENELNRPLNNEDERSRLLFGLWRTAVHENGTEVPTDASGARATARGSLAHYYTETLLRIAQQRGDNARISEEGIECLQQILHAQDENLADPSPMMLAEYGPHLQVRAPDWFSAHLLPRFEDLGSTPQATTLWAGLLARRFPGPRLRDSLRHQIRTAWPHVTTNIPGSTEAFIQLHAICFAFDFGASNPDWADAFLAHAPESERARWIRSVAHYLDQNGEAGIFQELIFAHWEQRLDGQPPLSETEQRALLRWLTLPNIDVPRAAELFVRGPAVAVSEDDLYDYYDLDRFPHEEHPAHYVRVANHLMQKNISAPPFVEQLVAAATKIAETDRFLAEKTFNALLSLGYSPARTHLEILQTPS